MLRDIQTNYPVGAKYLTVREIATKFGVAYGTADKAVRRLAQDGVATVLQGSGITIRALAPQGDLTGKRICVLAPPGMSHEEPEAFRWGAESVARQEGIEVSLVLSTYGSALSYGFGDYIAGLDADGVIAVFFTNAALGFYRALNLGVDLVSDMYYEEFPVLPVVQTDNLGNGRRAAETLRAHGRDQALIVSCNGIDPSVCHGYFADRVEGFLSYARGAKMECRILVLTTPGAMSMLNAFLYQLDKRKAVFTLDVESNTIVAAQFLRYKIPAKDHNFMVYDSLGDFHLQPGLDPIPAAGPSLEKLGAALAAKLVRKWKTGAFGEPLRELV